ncbi:hypothetical protein F5B20DRAFT_563736 [Whalleya microplaca]|nr:hypothetical protein F5B20DRAFT_563736 [Whalleya microplaca]
MSDLSSLSPNELEAALNGPALQPPPGITPDFDNPPNRNAAALAAIIVCLTLPTISAILYTYGRVFYVKIFHVSDLFGLAAYGAFVGFIYANYRVYEGTGYFVHQWDIRLKDINDFVVPYTLGIVMYIFTIMLVKAAILLQLVRIFVPTGTRNFFFWLCITLTTVEVLYHLVAGLITVIPCAPFEAHLDDLATCSPGSQYIDLISASMNVLLDYIIFLFPQRVIWRLQMSKKRRLGISLIFAIGLLGCIAATARIGVTIYYYTHEDFYNDSTYSLSYLALLPLAETTCGLLVFCIPGTPKALTDLGGNRLAVSIRSWTNISVQALRSKSSWRTLEQPSLQDPKPSLFEKAETSSHLRTPESGEDGNGTASIRPSQDRGLDNNGTAIICTTQFTAAESYDPSQTSYKYPHQHPWA